jgi:hypothetical protein
MELYIGCNNIATHNYETIKTILYKLTAIYKRKYFLKYNNI